MTTSSNTRRKLPPAESKQSEFAQRRSRYRKLRDCDPHAAYGFTLVETMTVVAVLSVLAAITLPVFLSAREVGRRAVCIANLHQISIAFAMYVDDWDGAFPNTGDPYLWMGRRWRWPLEPYLGERLQRNADHLEDPLHSKRTPSFLLCPSDPYAREQWDATSYGYSAAFYHTPAQIAQMTTEDLWKWDRFACKTQREACVLHPDKKVMIAEWLTNHEVDKRSWWEWGGARSYLFADGHAAHIDTDLMHPAGNHLPDPNLTIGGLTGKDFD